MDAKPHRPVRALRVGDENAPPELPAGKALHQRNKSTPALSTLMQNGGLKQAGAKRGAFAPLNNASNTFRPPVAQDDMQVPGKTAGPDALKDPENAAVKDSAKPSALLRPAQRPISTIVPKPAQASVSVTIASVVSKPLGNGVALQPVNARKVATKKITTIFKESPSDAASEAQVDGIAASLADAVLPSRDDPVLDIEDVDLRATEEKVQADRLAPHSEIDPHMRAPFAELTHAAAAVSNRDSQPQEELEDNDAHIQPTAVHPSVIDSFEYLDALEEQAKVIEHLRNEELRSDPDEYWDEEDEEEYYDADGYTTARSLRSRGDNTTGGVTIVLAPRVTAKSQRELEAARLWVEAHKTPEDVEDEQYDTSMVAEYGEEIFEYMTSLEERMKPSATYMDHQAEIQWSMRSVLMDWIVQVHNRFGLLPETLFLSVNYVDRFLSCKVVSLGKLQLVGATALFLAAKYEEINCPSVSEIVYMVDGAYTAEEILKAERFMLSMLQFELGWPGPMSFLRRISKADDYDVETRTLAKYFLEIAIMDERFVGCVPSFVAAGAHCLARLMLKKGDWTLAHIHYSGYTLQQLRQLLTVMFECCENPQKHHAAVYEKYADKRYKKASIYVANEIANGFQLPFATNRESLARFSLGHSWRRK